MRRNLIFVASLLIVLAMAACARTQPIYNVKGAPVVTSSANALTAEQVKDAITTAAQSKGWIVEQIKDGHMVATILVRQHTGVVDINYTATEYDITYKDSDVLMYDGQNIHRNYNKWVKHLDERISQNLNAL